MSLSINLILSSPISLTDLLQRPYILTIFENQYRRHQDAKTKDQNQRLKTKTKTKNDNQNQRPRPRATRAQDPDPRTHDPRPRPRTMKDFKPLFHPFPNRHHLQRDRNQSRHQSPFWSNQDQQGIDITHQGLALGLGLGLRLR